eukprot:CAMPEP_0119307388 /NCGR_PEP_ID=MMETSP1333-20130426/7907_1 /TAXON_ID=418940 /ORGANISM="Scyphosphaera apsteinii, Strain RCC1455" /LENGTH=590 /DNA_ID=CAMNT_0007310929 /DNA_START=150 /DNA_END=1922 /DNA_ORIENTATION=-
MKGFGSLSMHETESSILEHLQQLYAEKLRPLEKKSLYNEMGEPALSDAWFDAKPMVLLIGQYSVGKTSFIKYLLGRRYLGGRIGPEMTTDKFVAVMYGDAEKTTPGNALTSQPGTPFYSLKKFGTNFLNRLEATALPTPILKRVTLVDSPGVLSGQKQRDRGYEFNRVIKWFVQHSDRILLLFDAYKLDLSDEFKDVMKLLRDHEKKVRVVLNKADQISSQDLMRVYGALMWMLGGIVSAAEVPRVYIGSFWDEPWEHKGMVDLMEAEEGDLVEDLAALPQNNVMNKINEIARRARVVEAHTHLLAHLRSCVMSTFFGKAQAKERLCTEEGMEHAFAEVQRAHDLSRGDFPKARELAEFLRSYDFGDFYKPSQERSKKLRLLRELMEDDIPKLISKLHSVQERQRKNPLQPRVQFRPVRMKRRPPPADELESTGDTIETSNLFTRRVWPAAAGAAASASASLRSMLPNVPPLVTRSQPQPQPAQQPQTEQPPQTEQQLQHMPSQQERPLTMSPEEPAVFASGSDQQFDCDQTELSVQQVDGSAQQKEGSVQQGDGSADQHVDGPGNQESGGASSDAAFQVESNASPTDNE